MHEGKGVSRISISLPSELLEEFDGFISFLNMDRSKAVQVAMRNFLTEYKAFSSSGDSAGVISIIYDHDVKGLEESITDIQHEYNDMVIATVHAHLTRSDCMEVVIVKGKAERIKEFSEKLMSNRGVKQLKLTLSYIGP
ncbi:MAG: nickel-responsive transcriptional regulator NikR [Candidatus Jordarchaeales archaeon]